MKARLRAVVHSPFLADGVALLYTALYMAWLTLHTPGTTVGRSIPNLVLLPVGVVIGVANVRNAIAVYRAERDRRTAAGWLLLAASSLVLWSSWFAWVFVLSPRGFGQVPAVVEGLDYLQRVLIVAACVAFPSLRPSAERRGRFLFDMALVLVASGVLATYVEASTIRWSAGVRHLQATPLALLFAWASFFAVTQAMLYRRDRTIRVAMAFQFAGMLAVLLANWVLFNVPGAYRAGGYLDALWFFGWASRLGAARFAWHRYRALPQGARWDRRAGVAVIVIPYVIVASAFALIVLRAAIGTGELDRASAYAAVVMALLLTGRQVSELRANRRLYASQLVQEARYRSLVQHSSDVVVVADAAGRVAYASPSVEHVLGVNIETGTPVRTVIQADDDAAFARTLDGQARGHIQGRVRTGGGEWRRVDIAAADLRSDPAVAGIVLVCRDVTERDELERRLLHAQKLDALGHLAGGMAHEFNNALTSVRGHAELLRDDVPVESPAAEDLDCIAQAVDHAAGVTRKLLAFSRKQVVQPTTLNLNAVLSGLEPIARRIAGARVIIATSYDRGVWPVRADAGQLEQVVINLVTNARDAMPEGGRVVLATSNRTVIQPESSCGFAPAGDYAGLKVLDTGSGMTEDVRARIFEPFFSTKSKERGLGLGLAMVQGIVAQSGGYVAVDSAPGAGSAFTILLPRVATEPTVRTVTARQPRPVTPTARRVLVVDDEQSVRNVVRRLLERASCEVVDVSSGDEAVALLAQDARGFDLILTDLVMPGMHGRDLIRHVQLHLPGTPIVCMTGYAGEVLDADTVETGPVVLVTKPFSFEILSQAIAAAVAKTGAR
jgi:PAS domain S-box-containing protein